MPQPVAIITGAGRGIGRATAILLAAQNYALALISRSQTELDETARLCGGGMILTADISRSAEVDLAVEQVWARYGRIDALVHAAGAVYMLGVEQMSDVQWQSTLDTNLSAAFYFCRRLWPVWREQGGGVAVLISSQAARDPFPNLSAYAAAKAGMNLLGLALSREGAALGIRIHTVAPGATETAMLRSILSREQLPTERTMSPDEVARVVVQCVSGDLHHTNGETIYLQKSGAS